MKILVDTSVWSLALRRASERLNLPEQVTVAALEELVRAGQVAVLGTIRQEVLSGVRTAQQFQTLVEQLAAFDDLTIETDDYIRAAAFYNQCRAAGVTGTHVDMLICAVAHRFRLPIFTSDTDFERYAKILPITLHTPTSRTR